jgi:hypothetical protein
MIRRENETDLSSTSFADTLVPFVSPSDTEGSECLEFTFFIGDFAGTFSGGWFWKRENTCRGGFEVFLL